MKSLNQAFLLTVLFLTASCNGSGSGSGNSDLPLTVNDTGDTGGTGGEVTPISLSADLAGVNGEVLKLNGALWAECQGTCPNPKVKKLINPNKVNSNNLKNNIYGFDEMGGFSWNKLKYFGPETSKEFLGNLLRNDILKFNLDKLCALNEILPKGLDGRFLAGEFQVDTSEFPILDNCGVMGNTLNLDGTIMVENHSNGSFEKRIRFNGEEILLGNKEEKFVYGEFSPTIKKRLTMDKERNILAVEKIQFTPAEDTLVRVYLDGMTNKLSILANHTSAESVQFTLASELAPTSPRYEKLNMRAKSLGGVATSSPQATGCIDLSTGLISEIGYDACPTDFGLSINESNPTLFVLYFTPIGPDGEELEFLDEQDIFQNEI